MADKKFYVILGVKVEAGQIKKLESGLKSFEEKAKKVGTNLRNVGVSMTKYVAAPLIAIGGVSLKMAGDFEAAMNMVAAKTGSVGEDFDRLRAKALEMGIKTQFSASEVANAMVEFGKAGLKTDQILSSIEASLGLAAAAGLDMAEVAKIAADTMSQFGLESSSVADIADILTKAANSSTTDVNELSDALSYAGPIAGASGVSLEQTATVLAAFANNGVKASRAGTALANVITALRAPTAAGAKVMQELGIAPSMFVDSAGKLKMSVKESLALLKARGMTATQLNKLFEKETGRSLAGLMNNLAGITKLEAEMTNRVGYAGEQGAKMLEGFNGSIKQLKSSFEGLMIAIADTGLLDFFTKAILKLNGFVQGLAAMNPWIKNTVLILAGMAIGISGITLGLGGLILMLGMTSGALARVAVAAWAAIAPFLIAHATLIIVIAAVAALGAALYLLYDDLRAWFDGRPSVFGVLVDWAKAAWSGVKAIFSDGVAWIGDVLKKIPGVKSAIEFFTGDLKGGIARPGAGQVPVTSGGFSEYNSTVGAGTQTVSIAPSITINASGTNATAESIGRAAGDEVARASRSAANSLRPVFTQ